MRISAETIREEGTRISAHSKFYIWNDMLFEPSLYRGKPTKSYKPVTDRYRVMKAMEKYNELDEIPTISSVSPNIPVKNKGTFKHDRFCILDL